MSEIFSGVDASASRSWSRSCGDATIRCRSTSSRPRCPTLRRRLLRLALRPRSGPRRRAAGDPHRRRRLAAGDRLRLLRARGIRVLSAAPAFAAAVAEMALALALACSRDLVAEDRAMRAGDERFLSSATRSTPFSCSGSASASSASGTSVGSSAGCSSPSPASSVPTTRGSPTPTCETRASSPRSPATPRDLARPVRARVPDERERSAAVTRAARACAPTRCSCSPAGRTWSTSRR